MNNNARSKPFVKPLAVIKLMFRFDGIHSHTAMFGLRFSNICARL